MTQYLKTNWNYDSKKLVEVYDELPLWAAPFGLKLLDGIKYKKGINAVDIGFGTGFPLTEIAMRLGSDSKVYGIDPWNTGIDRAEKKIEFYGIKNIEVIRGIAEDIPIKDKSIDLIVSNNGLNNVTDLDKSLSECSRIIKTGGQFIQTMNLNDSMIEFYSIMGKVLTNLKLRTCLEAMQKQIYKKRKPLDQYIRQIESHGFLIESVKQDKFEYKFVDGTTMLNHYFIRLAFIDGWKEIVPIDKQEEVFRQIEIELNRQSQTDGIFKLSVPFVLIDCEKK
ncbi:class I SAM-dependent methyltransferase [Maribellus luteus]|uniref:Class I SAM-dependent methyltransferase n=1 Tax=Maribellus luteus TaxID=2305463 RepID=A0A399SZX2_9BACT|nr:class I SAM-dependent methyltransferase [Maribellus luteus]RIJ47925.1 class I SAM-dependent methyltransferase [Maribellus luteus]